MNSTLLLKQIIGFVRTCLFDSFREIYGGLQQLLF